MGHFGNFQSFSRSQRWERQILPHLEATGFPGGLDGNESSCNAGDLGLIPWRRKRLPTPVFWPGEFHGQRSLAGYKSMGSQRVRHNWVAKQSPASSEIGLPRWLSDKESTYQCRKHRCGFNSWVGRIPWSRKWQCIPVILPGKFQRQRRIAGYSPQGGKESDTTEHTHTHTHTHTHIQGLRY